MQMFVATSFIIATSFCLLETNNFTICLLETSLQLMNEYPPSYEWMKMSVYIQDNIFHMTKNAVLTQATTQINFENVITSERNQSQRQYFSQISYSH